MCYEQRASWHSSRSTASRYVVDAYLEYKKNVSCFIASSSPELNAVILMMILMMMMMMMMMLLLLLLLLMMMMRLFSGEQER